MEVNSSLTSLASPSAYKSEVDEEEFIFLKFQAHNLAESS